MKFDIVTFGSGSIDVFVDTGISEKQNSITYPLGEKILINDLKFYTGGGGTNTAVAFARLGFKTGWIGIVGNDREGKEILSEIKKEKILFLGRNNSKVSTGYSIVLHTVNKERTILTYRGANNTTEFYPQLKNIQTKWLYCSSTLGKSLDTQKKLVRSKTKEGVKLAFNPSHYLIENEDIKELLRLTEVLILNKEEARALKEKLKIKSVNMLHALHTSGPKIVVITDGKHKIECYSGYEKKHFTLMPHVIKVVEQTGAGDAFAAGFVAMQVKGKSIEESLAFGLRESESVLGAFGAKNNLLKMHIK